MKNLSKFISLSLLIVLYASKTTAAETDCTNLDKSVLIRNQLSGLMLDARNSTTVTIEQFDKSENQQWYFQLSGVAGKFNIISASHGLALGVNPESNEAVGNSPNSHNLTLTTLTDSDSQRWIVNSDGTIANAGWYDEDTYWGINIPGAEYFEGNYVIAYPLSDDDNEKFILEFGV